MEAIHSCLGRNPLTIHLHKQLKKLRDENRITQQELASHLNVSTQAVSKWENARGYPDILLLPKIAAYFRVSVDTLLGIDTNYD